MKRTVKTLLILIIAAPAWAMNALAQQADTAPAPIEAFYCNYQDEKGIEDLMKVAKRLDKWADKNFSSYSAWVLTPVFGQLGDLPEVLWLGSSTSGDLFGKGQDAYMADGGDIQAEFDKVVDCYAHALASSVPVHAPDGPPGDGVVMFSQCYLGDDSDWNKAVAGHKAFADAMRALGANNSNWAFFPMLGGSGDTSFDYWGVTTFGNWTEYFSAYELYVNGGGWQKQMEALEGAASCDVGTATVWDVALVRQGER